MLFIALLVMVALSLAGIALIRSADTATIVAGNLAFKQAAAAAVDRSIEQAVEALFNPQLDPTTSTRSSPTRRSTSRPRTISPASGLTAGSIPEIPARAPIESARSPAAGLNAGLVPVDAAGNKSLLRDRADVRQPRAPPSAATAISRPPRWARTRERSTTRRSRASGDAYYRVTVRVEGPRNTVQYAQAILK